MPGRHFAVARSLAEAAIDKRHHLCHLWRFNCRARCQQKWDAKQRNLADRRGVRRQNDRYQGNGKKQPRNFVHGAVSSVLKCPHRTCCASQLRLTRIARQAARHVGGGRCGDAQPMPCRRGRGDAQPMPWRCGRGDAQPMPWRCGCGDAQPMPWRCGRGDAQPMDASAVWGSLLVSPRTWTSHLQRGTKGCCWQTGM